MNQFSLTTGKNFFWKLKFIKIVDNHDHEFDVVGILFFFRN